MGVLGYIAGQDLRRPNVGRQFLHGLFLALALVSQDYMRAFANKGLGDGVGDAPLIGDSEHQGNLALHQLGHELTIVSREPCVGIARRPVCRAAQSRI